MFIIHSFFFKYVIIFIENIKLLSRALVTIVKILIYSSHILALLTTVGLS